LDVNIHGIKDGMNLTEQEKQDLIAFLNTLTDEVYLNNQEYKAYLDKTSWRCWAEKTTQSGNLFIRALHCNYSVEALGSFKSYASCGVGKIFDEVSVELKDERKNLDLKVILTCRYSESENP